MKVLIIGNKPELTKHMTLCLRMRYPRLDVVLAKDAEDGISFVESESPDLVFVQSPLPSADCTTVIRDIRSFSDVGLILMAAPDDTAMEHADYLEAGADECIATPLNAMDFLGRVNALMRRMGGNGVDVKATLAVGNCLVVDIGTREVFVSGSRVTLTPTEYRLLFELVRNAGRVLTHHLLLQRVWSLEYTDDTTVVRKYVHRLRRKIEANPQAPRLVLSERGVGYRLARLS